MINRQRKTILPVIVLLFLFLAPGPVFAHVTVHPEKSAVGAWEKYTVRVPVEKDMNTTKVKLDIPKAMNVANVMPVENWDWQMTKDKHDIVSSVTWTATDEGIKPNEFTEFSFVAANPSEPGTFSWNAYQTYEDGSVVEWVKEPDADEPASVTKVVSKDTVEAETASNEVTQQNERARSNASSGGIHWVPISLSVLAILLALISLFRKQA